MGLYFLYVILNYKNIKKKFKKIQNFYMVLSIWSSKLH